MGQCGIALALFAIELNNKHSIHFDCKHYYTSKVIKTLF